MLLVHAFPLDASMWQPQRAAFDVPVLAPNLPGFGGTPDAGPVLTMEAAAGSCVEHLDAAGTARAVVCGLSMGGYVAFELWRRHPERVAGLVLANTRAETDDKAGIDRRRALALRLREQGSGFLVESPPPLLSKDAPEEVWRRVREIIAAQPAEAIAAASLGMAERADSRPDLSRIRVPTLVVTSTGDELIPPEISSPMTEAIPGARLAVLEGAGHLSNMESPEEFNRLLAAHMRRCT